MRLGEGEAPRASGQKACLPAVQCLRSKPRNHAPTRHGAVEDLCAFDRLRPPAHSAEGRGAIPVSMRAHEACGERMVSPHVHGSRAGGGIPAQREPLRVRITGSAVSLFAVAVTAGYSPTLWIGG
jgi:hypothetical protein